MTDQTHCVLWEAEPEDLETLVDALAASVAIIDLEDGQPGPILAFNEEFRDMLQIPAGDEEPHALREVVPRYAWTQLDDCLRTSVAEARPLELEQAYDFGDDTKWWRVNVKPILDDAGAVRRILLTCLDISERMHLEEELQIANSRYGAVIESAYDGIITIDQDQRISLINQSAQEMFGYRAAEVVGENITSLMPERFRSGHGEHVDHFGKSPINARQMFERGSILGLRQDGSEFPVEVSISKITVGGRTEFTAVVRDISERARLIDELQTRATTDPLTGLFNRRMFNEKAREMIALAERHKRSLSVLMLDLDHFKAINDTHGHAAGDEVLAAMASAGRQVIRLSDVLARLGGEEFAVLAPESTVEQAAELAERLRAAVEAAAFEHEWKEVDPIDFRLSIGVAAWQPGEETLDSALSRADKALYTAKQNGRNRVEIAA